MSFVYGMGKLHSISETPFQVSIGNNSLDVMIGADDSVSCAETESTSQREIVALVQRLLAKSTHPSPVKVTVQT